MITSAKFKMLRTCTHTDVHRHTTSHMTTVRLEEKKRRFSKRNAPIHSQCRGRPPPRWRLMEQTKSRPRAPEQRSSCRGQSSVREHCSTRGEHHHLQCEEPFLLLVDAVLNQHRAWLCNPIQHSSAEMVDRFRDRLHHRALQPQCQHSAKSRVREDRVCSEACSDGCARARPASSRSTDRGNRSHRRQRTTPPASVPPAGLLLQSIVEEQPALTMRCCSMVHARRHP